MPALRLPLLLAFVFALTAAAPAGAQVLYGRVTDAADGARVAAALISVVDEAGNPVANTISGTDGSYDLPLPAGGSVRVYVSRIGFRTGISPEVVVGEGERIGVDLALRPDAVQMEALQAQARITPAFRDRRALGFYDRMDDGMGRYLTREQIVARGAHTTSELLRDIPGIHFAGGARSTNLWMGGNVLRRPGTGSLGGCTPFVYIDGFLQKLGHRPLDDFVEPSEIWGIEVYRYAYEIPSELPRQAMLGNCGAIVIWTLDS
jgi:hypothetical protein